jgi:hypothetical protein
VPAADEEVVERLTTKETYFFRQEYQLRSFAKELLPANGSQRQRLARWITHRENRAFARETVNRAWASAEPRATRCSVT